MTKSPGRGKKRQTLVEDFDHVPHILAEARRAVDEVTQAPQNQGGGGGKTPAPPKGEKGAATTPKGQKAAPRKKSAKEGGRQKQHPRPPAPPAPSVGPARSLAYFGITVKHALPGRIRLRLRNMLHNETLAAKLPRLLAAVPGVASVEASTATGSLLITFNPRELAAAKVRQDLAGVMHQFFPGLDVEGLMKRMLCG